MTKDEMGAPPGGAAQKSKRREVAGTRVLMALQSLAGICGDPATSEEERNALNGLIGRLRETYNRTKDPTLYEATAKGFAAQVVPVDDIGEYVPEEEDPNVLIYGGPWLERGGSAFWVSTAGTGKSIASMQIAHCWAAGIPFAGLRPSGKLRVWVFQSEDSPRRVAQDRIDVRAEIASGHPEIDWSEVSQRIRFVKLDGRVGGEFLEWLDGLLGEAKERGELPDLVVLNPLLAFVGGPITDGSYVTPFLRGGRIGDVKTKGLQALLEKHRVGVLVFHHTPKPPTDKEIDAWMKSAFPEYQGAGSSDLTNWGRSFVTMMRVKGHPDMVCVTAGKNGADLGWERVGGAFRRYLAYSREIGISGRGRHAWRELTPEEADEIIGKERDYDEGKVQAAIGRIVERLHETAMTAPGMRDAFSGVIVRNVVREAVSRITAQPEAWHITVKQVLVKRNWVRYYGFADSLKKVEALAGQFNAAPGNVQPPQELGGMAQGSNNDEYEGSDEPMPF